MSHGTPSEIDGQYIQFQTEILRQLPRPGAIDDDVLQGWLDNRGTLKEVLRKALVPAKPTPELHLLKQKAQLNHLDKFQERAAFYELHQNHRIARTLPVTVWSEGKEKFITPATLHIYVVKGRRTVLDVYHALGERNFAEWVDIYRLLKMQQPDESGYLSRRYPGNYFFVNGRLIQVALNDAKNWVVVERPLIPRAWSYLDLRKGARIFVR